MNSSCELTSIYITGFVIRLYLILLMSVQTSDVKKLKFRYRIFKKETSLYTGYSKKKLHVKPFSMIVTSLFVFGSWKFQINEWESYLITWNQGPKAGWSLWPRRRPCSQPFGRVNGLDRASSAHFYRKKTFNL